MAYLKEANIRERTHEPLSATHRIPEPVFGPRRLSTGKRRLLAGEATQPRPFHRHPAAVQANLAFRLAPAMRCSVVLRLFPCGWAARRSGVVFHHQGRRSTRRDLRGKAETYRNAPSYSQALRSLRARDLRWIGSVCSWCCFPSVRQIAGRRKSTGRSRVLRHCASAPGRSRSTGCCRPATRGINTDGVCPRCLRSRWLGLRVHPTAPLVLERIRTGEARVPSRWWCARP
jgi:hypothetical protein